jgi:beta-lactamase regulating signal transducer with metallopeptidase domain
MNGATLGIPLGFTWLFVVYATVMLVVSAVAAGLAARGTRRVGQPGPLLALRLLPGLGAMAFVAAVFAPSYARFEPAETAETVSLSVALLSAAGLVAFARGGMRVWRALKRTSDTRARWMRSARRLTAIDDPIPCFVVDDADATVSLVGIMRPAVFVSKDVARALSPAELAVTVAHERAHVTAQDNFKRMLLLACPDAVLFRHAARWLERAWQAATECAADARAVAGQPVRRVHLASALLAVARVAPRAVPDIASSSIHDAELLALRVRRLLAASDVPEQAPTDRRWLRRVAVIALVSVAAAGPLEALWISVHRATEMAVRFLP